MDRHRAELAEEADRVSHVLGAGRAVEADDVDLERLERRQGRADVGPEQHLSALRQQRHGALDRDRPAGRGERLTRAEHRRLQLQHVLRRLDDDQVDAALDQSRRLLGEHLSQLPEADLAERRVIGGGQKAGGADRAGDERPLAGCAPGDLRGADVDLPRVIVETPLAELEPRCLERVGLQHLGAGLDHRCVYTLDHVRAVEHERLVAAAREAVVVLEAEVELLKGRAHSTVEHDGSLTSRRQDSRRIRATLANLDTVVARLCGPPKSTVIGDWFGQTAYPRARRGRTETCRV